MAVLQADQSFCDTNTSVLLSNQLLQFDRTLDFIKGNNVGALSFFIGECTAIFMLHMCGIECISSLLFRLNHFSAGTTRDNFEGRQVARLEYGTVLLTMLSLDLLNF